MEHAELERRTRSILGYTAYAEVAIIDILRSSSNNDSSAHIAARLKQLAEALDKSHSLALSLFNDSQPQIGGYWICLRLMPDGEKICRTEYPKTDYPRMSAAYSFFKEQGLDTHNHCFSDERVRIEDSETGGAWLFSVEYFRGFFSNDFFEPWKRTNSTRNT